MTGTVTTGAHLGRIVTETEAHEALESFIHQIISFSQLTPSFIILEIQSQNTNSSESLVQPAISKSKTMDITEPTIEMSVDDGKKSDGLWNDAFIEGGGEQQVMSLFNETILLKNMVSILKKQICGLFTIVVVLLFSAVGISIANLKSQKAIYIDGTSGAMVTTEGKVAVSTLGTGLRFHLPVFNDGVGNSTPPYTCVGVSSAVDLWNAAADGITTNVVLFHLPNDQSKYNYEVEGAGGVEIGATLIWHGSFQTEDRSCLRTLDKNTSLCINFSSPQCGNAGDSAKEVRLDQDRRALFQKLVNGEDESLELVGGHRRMKSCNYGHWCSDL